MSLRFLLCVSTCIIVTCWCKMGSLDRSLFSDSEGPLMLQLAGHLLYLGYLGSLINRNKKNTTEIKGHCKQAFLFHSIHFDLS